VTDDIVSVDGQPPHRSMSTYDIYAYKPFCQRIYEMKAADKTNGVIFHHEQKKS